MRNIFLIFVIFFNINLFGYDYTAEWTNNIGINSIQTNNLVGYILSESLQDNEKTNIIHIKDYYCGLTNQYVLDNLSNNVFYYLQLSIITFNANILSTQSFGNSLIVFQYYPEFDPKKITGYNYSHLDSRNRWWENIVSNITYLGVKFDFATNLNYIQTYNIGVKSFTNPPPNQFYRLSMIITNNPFYSSPINSTNKYVYFGAKIDYGTNLYNINTDIIQFLVRTNPPSGEFYRGRLIITNGIINN